MKDKPKRFFVSRHAGAIYWAREEGIIDKDTVLVKHWTQEYTDQIVPGDIVIGTFPLALAARLCDIGARVWMIVMDAPPEMRGRELTASQMRAYNARVLEFVARCLGEPKDLKVKGGK